MYNSGTRSMQKNQIQTHKKRTQTTDKNQAQKAQKKQAQTTDKNQTQKAQKKQAQKNDKKQAQTASENQTHPADKTQVQTKENGKETWRAGNMLYPLPAVMVSCARQGEKPNIITVAWAGTVCTNPPMVSISVRPGRHSYRIIEETGEFVINLVTEKLTRSCDWCGVRSGRDYDKFAECGLTPEKAQELSFAPLIRQSPVNLECKVEQIIPLGSHDLFLARVVCVHVDRAGMHEKGAYDLGSAGLITYSHGEYYALGKKLGTFGYSVQKQKKGNPGNKARPEENPPEMKNPEKKHSAKKKAEKKNLQKKHSAKKNPQKETSGEERYRLSTYPKRNQTIK